MNNEQGLSKARAYWDDAAATFDEQPDHGLRDPAVRNRWRKLLASCLPPAPATILDIGCGTGSLSILLAAGGYRVTGIDLSPVMVARAGAKARAAGQDITLEVMDAASPQLGSRRFDVVLCRHLLWALPEPAAVLRRWVELAVPGGRLVLIEGYWNSGAGLHSREIVAALPSSLTDTVVLDLGDDSTLWGGEVTDERYVVTTHVATGSEGHRPG